MPTTITPRKPTVHEIRRAVDALGAVAVAARIGVDPTTVGRWTAAISDPPRSKWPSIRALLESVRIPAKAGK